MPAMRGALFLRLLTMAALLSLLHEEAAGRARNEKPPVTLRFHVEAPETSGESFVLPVTLQYARKRTHIARIPAVTEKDIVAVKTFPAPNGTHGAYFYLSPHGRIALNTLSLEHRGRNLVAFLNGRQVIDLLIDRRISDGVLAIPWGLTAAEAALLRKHLPNVDRR